MLIAVHGGAGLIEAEYIDLKNTVAKQAVKVGYDILANGSALDAVEMAVRHMEADPVMNCGNYYQGYGSTLTIDGTVECEASLMDGRTLMSGAVAGVQRIRYPISLARAVMTKTPHCLMIGSGAEQLAQEVGIDLVDNKSLIHEIALKRLKNNKPFENVVNASWGKLNNTVASGGDTVGAVAIDNCGNCAYATSTGGITAKRVGRVGDSPIVGAGGYADNMYGAVSTTGHGEAVVRVCLARHILYEFSKTNADGNRMSTLQQSVDASLEMMARRVAAL